MKKIYFIFFLLISISLIAQESYTINTELSKIEWKGRKIGGEHNGTIQVKSGSLNVEKGLIESGMITIDMRTILITDINNENSNQKLMEVFKDENFFNPAQYETAIFKITDSKKNFNNQIELKGILTIKDISKEISIISSMLNQENQLSFIGSIEIDRTDYKIKYGSGFFSSLGDNVIKDLFEIKFKVIAHKPKL